jgi:hypothetical protein
MLKCQVCNLTFHNMIIYNGKTLCENNHEGEFSCKSCKSWIDDKIGCYNSNFCPNHDHLNPTCGGLCYERR